MPKELAHVYTVETTIKALAGLKTYLHTCHRGFPFSSLDVDEPPRLPFFRILKKGKIKYVTIGQL